MLLGFELQSLDGREFRLVITPFVVVVLVKHQQCRHAEGDHREAEHNVHPLDVAKVLLSCRHFRPYLAIGLMS